jgi:hypothetical protein
MALVLLHLAFLSKMLNKRNYARFFFGLQGSAKIRSCYIIYVLWFFHVSIGLFCTLLLLILDTVPTTLLHPVFLMLPPHFYWAILHVNVLASYLQVLLSHCYILYLLWFLNISIGLFCTLTFLVRTCKRAYYTATSCMCNAPSTFLLGYFAR